MFKNIIKTFLASQSGSEMIYMKLLFLRLDAVKTSIYALWFSFWTTIEHLTMILIWGLAFIGSLLLRKISHLSSLWILLSIKDKFL